MTTQSRGSITHLVRNVAALPILEGKVEGREGEVSPYITRDGLPIAGSYAELEEWGFGKRPDLYEIILRPKGVRDVSQVNGL